VGHHEGQLVYLPVAVGQQQWRSRQGAGPASDWVRGGATAKMPTNAHMFAYLQAIYGKAWRRRVRPDVMGLSH